MIVGGIVIVIVIGFCLSSDRVGLSDPLVDTVHRLQSVFSHFNSTLGLFQDHQGHLLIDLVVLDQQHSNGRLGVVAVTGAVAGGGRG